jgi:tRNA(fMet)-specific endonuclease VapC
VMSYLYLLDTNIVSDMIRHPTGAVFQKISEVGEDSVCTNVIVACELRFGVYKSGSKSLTQKLEQVLKVLPVISLEPPVETYYAAIRSHLEQAGTPIGSNDMLIAAHALMLDLTVITANLREFSRVPNLRHKNWLQP